jgi:hypothetical protein
MTMEDQIADPEAQPETFSERRPILEQLVDFKVIWDGECVEIEGKIPVPVMEQKSMNSFNRS